jgi:hypothetical protein
MGMSAPTGSGGVPAAPNRCAIEARVLDVRRSERFPQRWDLEIEILSSRPLEGPNFAHPGRRSAAIAFGDLPAGAGEAIAAEAEFVGDQRGGVFQLSEVTQAAR